MHENLTISVPGHFFNLFYLTLGTMFINDILRPYDPGPLLSQTLNCNKILYDLKVERKKHWGQGYELK